MDVRLLALGLSGPNLVPSPRLATALLIAVCVAIAVLVALVGTDLAMIVVRRPVPEVRQQFVRWPYVRRNALVAAAAVPALALVVGVRLVTRSSVWTALIALLLVLLLAELARLAGQAPYGRTQRLPGRLRGRPRPGGGLRRRTYLGWSRGRFGDDGWALAADGDLAGVVGGPRTRKTAGVIVPNVAAHEGPVVVASVKRDVLQATVRHRQAVAETSGGPLYGVAPRVQVYEPSADQPVDGVSPLRWSPLDDCENLGVAQARATAAVATANGGANGQHNGHANGAANGHEWSDKAVRILAPYLLAGALYPEQERRGDLSLVTEWLVQGPPTMRRVATLLERSIGTPDAKRAAGWLRAEAASPQRELGSVFSFSTSALRAAAYDPVVRDNSARTEFDVDEFLLTNSTLYILYPTDEGQATAPLIAMLVDAMTIRAAQLHHEGKLPNPLLLALDGLDAIGPLPALPRVLGGEAAGAVRALWATGSWEALRDRWGEDGAAEIWEGTRARVVTGGLTDADLLGEVASVVARKDEEARSQIVPPEGVRDRSRFVELVYEVGRRIRLWWQDRAIGSAGQAVLGPDQLRALPRGWGVLLHPDAGATLVGLPVAADQRIWRRQLGRTGGRGGASDFRRTPARRDAGRGNAA
jgi:type IV secretion system protein VirD4